MIASGDLVEELITKLLGQVFLEYWQVIINAFPFPGTHPSKELLAAPWKRGN